MGNLTQTNLWEEKNLTDLKQNSSLNERLDNSNTTTKTETNSIKNDLNDTGKASGIYKIVNKVNGKYYVGSSKLFKNRWYKHKKMLKRGNHENSYLQCAWNKYGKDSFDFVIVEITDLLLEVEQKYLDVAKTEQDKCYNLNFVAACPPSWKGKTRSAETIQKMRDCKWGSNNPMFGKKITDEHKRIIGESSKNNPNCAWTLGKHLSDEHRKHVSDGLKKMYANRRKERVKLFSSNQ